jgi:hypothetical protein
VVRPGIQYYQPFHWLGKAICYPLRQIGLVTSDGRLANGLRTFHANEETQIYENVSIYFGKILMVARQSPRINEKKF